MINNDLYINPTTNPNCFSASYALYEDQPPLNMARTTLLEGTGEVGASSNFLPQPEIPR